MVCVGWKSDYEVVECGYAFPQNVWGDIIERVFVSGAFLVNLLLDAGWLTYPMYLV